MGVGQAQKNGWELPDVIAAINADALAANEAKDRELREERQARSAVAAELQQEREARISAEAGLETLRTKAASDA